MKMRKKLTATLSIIALMSTPVLAYAETMQPGQSELVIAKACHLYNTGRLQEALNEFQSILTENPANESARQYRDKIWLKLNEGGISSEELGEQLIGYRNALAARKKIEVTDQEKVISGPGDKTYERFINKTTIGSNERDFQSSADSSFSKKGLFVAEEMRMDTSVNDWRNTLSLDARYNKSDIDTDLRLRRATYALNSPGGIHFIAGDTSTALSRYTLRGMYYRGVNLSTKTENNDFRILWGEAPHYLTKTTANTNSDRDKYIYPRKVFGIRDAYKVMDGYKIGVSFMELKDSQRVHSIDANYNPKLNRVISIDQDIDAVKDVWKIKTESAYATSDEDTTGQNIFITDRKLKDFANYVRSDIVTPKFKLIDSYERINPEFRSYADLASTNSTWMSGITSDREKIENYLEYRPFDFDPIYFDLHLNRVRNNLDKETDLEMSRRADYGGALRFVPEEYEWLPQSSIRLNFTNSVDVAGSQYASSEKNDHDVIFELAKRIYGVDLDSSYTRRKTTDNIDTFGSYSNIYNVNAAKQLTDMILFSAAYLHSNTQKDQNDNTYTTGKQDDINLNTALRLWAGSNLSLGYTYEDQVDSTGILADIKANTYSATFSWPLSKYFYQTGTELSLAPYLTYQLEDGRGHSQNRSVWTAAVDATYQIQKDHRVSFNALYRDDRGDNGASTDTKENRFLLTYQKIFQ